MFVHGQENLGAISCYIQGSLPTFYLIFKTYDENEINFASEQEAKWTKNYMHHPICIVIVTNKAKTA